jgi:glycosyltransferase involved in cell wall biosynthesis
MKIGLYADINPNLIDGSTIWLQDLAMVISGIDHVSLSVLVRGPVRDDIIVDPLRQRSIHVEEIETKGVAGNDEIRMIAEALRSNAQKAQLDLLIVRGDTLIERLAEMVGTFDCPVWAYWLRRPDVVSPASDRASHAVCKAFPKIIVQSFEHKAILESRYGVPAGKLIALPPMIPPEAWAIDRQRPDDLSLVYSGKIDASYNVEAFLDLPRRLNDLGIPAELLVLGNKFNLKSGDPAFKRRMKQKLGDTPGTSWLGGVGRPAAMQTMASASVGLCVRQEGPNPSLQISTKLIEFCALGVPPITNRTAAHQNLLGSEYPYFADTIGELVDCLADISKMPEALDSLGQELRQRVVHCRRDRAASDLVRAIVQLPNGTNMTNRDVAAPLRLLFAGHEFKFLDALFPFFLMDPRFDVRFDKWEKNRIHEADLSQTLIEWADIVFCEWCSGAAVWYSENISAGQRLIIRLHRFELFSPHPERVEFDSVDRLIVVSDYFKERCATDLGVDRNKIDVLPQFVDCHELDRPKHSWAAQTLGFVGINSFSQKRLDRAVDLLERLRAMDRKWRMRIRSTMPWDLPWIWRDDRQKNSFRAVFAKLAADRDLSDAIIFDLPGPDMAEWYRNVSFIVSTSESEGCHTAVAEGMASGAYPLVLDWPGSRTLYPQAHIAGTVSGLADIANGLAETRRKEGPDEMKAQAAGFDIAHTVRHLVRLFTESDLKDLAPVVHVRGIDQTMAIPTDKKSR